MPALTARAPSDRRAMLRRLAPGIAIAGGVALGATLLAPLVGRIAPVPAMVLALVLGILLHEMAARPAFQPGLAFCLKTLLRWAVALLGLRIALLDIVDLGASAALLVMIAMAVTIVAGFLVARSLGSPNGFGALVGAATAVCGASATLATSAVVPSYPGKEADIAFVVVAVNALSTAAMVLYPPFCALLGFDARTTGLLLGATIHDVAQVVGAGYAVSEPAGNTAVVVKLFRVFLLLPTVLVIGWCLARQEREQERAKVPAPAFALVFLALCILNSIAVSAPGVKPLYMPVKALLTEAADWGLLVAIGALGLATSIKALAGVGWRHLAAVSATTLVILAVVTAALAVM